MSLDQYVSLGGRAFNRARDLEQYLTELAAAARSVGCENEARNLEKIASRAMPMASFFVNQLKEKVS